MSPSASDRLVFGGAQTRLEGWSLLTVEGDHRERFLHSQLTSDVRDLDLEATQPTALLDRSGRIQGFGSACKRADSIDLLVPEGAASHIMESLENSIIADDVSIREVETQKMTLALGAEAVRLTTELPSESFFPVTGWGSRGFVTWVRDEFALEQLDEDEVECRRVLSGLPRWGGDVVVGTPIHETTLIETAVSFDKGCYLGQETVAKVASGRGAARGPMLLELISGGPDLERLPGQTFATPESDRAGEFTACADWQGSRYLAARLKRNLRVVGKDIECRAEDGQKFQAVVRAFPLLSPPPAEAWAHDLTVRAAAEFTADRDDEAIHYFECAIAVCPGFADAYESLGVIHGRHGRFDEAIGLMKRLLELDPSSVMAHTNLSLYYNQLGRIEDAEREAAEAMRAGMRREKADRDLETAASREAEAVAADRRRRAELFRQVVELDPDDALANFGLGELAVEEDRFREAVEHLERALKTDPAYSAALLVLGRAHEGLGDLETARRIYRDGIETSSSKGDLMTANKMQERLVGLGSEKTQR